MLQMSGAINGLREDVQLINWLMFEKLGLTNEDRDKAVALAEQ